MYTLRPYQQKAVDSAIKFFDYGKKSAISILPTGSGKSLIIANIARVLDGNTLIFQPSKEILEQNFEKLLSYDPFIQAKVFSASLNQKEIGKVTYATIGSAINRMSAFSEFNNVIVDECHLVNSNDGMYKRFLSSLHGKKILGLTATPYRLNIDGYGGAMLKFLTRTSPRIFSEVIHHDQIGDLTRDGYLSKVDYYQIKGFDLSKLEINSTQQDYTDRSIKEYYHEIKFEDKVADIAQRLLAKRKNLLIFTKFVEEAKHVKKILGHECEFVSADTHPRERSRILKDFRSGAVKAVANVGILTTGFDFPELETVLLARTTRSLGLYYQMIGRSIRPHINKQSSWVVDMCGSYETFGKIEDMVLENEGGNKWYYRNQDRKLTNVYL